MGRSKVRITIACPLAQVFATYTQPDTFCWSDFRSVRWSSGQPWQVESRMRIEPENAFGVVVDQVVTHFEPNRRIDYISHFGGITMQSQVRFKALADNLTELESEFEFVGSFSRIAGFAVGPAIEFGVRKFYSDFHRQCECN
jgi:hypothetical protein